MSHFAHIHFGHEGANPMTRSYKPLVFQASQYTPERCPRCSEFGGQRFF